MAITIKKTTLLYHKYQNETHPQPCYVELNCETKELKAYYDNNLGNVISINLFNHRSIRWKIATLKEHVADKLLEEIKSRCEKIIEGYKSEPNSQGNYIGTFTEKARDLIDYIQEICDDYDELDNILIIWNADDYLQHNSPDELGIKANTTNKEIEKIATELEKEADMVDIIEDTEKYLQGVRNKLQEELKDF